MKIEVTEKAATKIKSFLDEKNLDTNKYGFRIAVKGGGCSGFRYNMDLDSQNEQDNIFEKDGIKVLVCSTTLKLINGSVLNYYESIQGSGFDIKNPNATANCGCGESFAV